MLAASQTILFNGQAARSCIMFAVQADGAHSHRPEEIRRGLQAGVDGFEHTGLATAPEYPIDIIEQIRERAAQGNRGPLFWTPTIEGLFNYEYIRENPEKLDDPSWHGRLTARPEGQSS